jgi:dTDP-4-dehydrorhamnose reductase
MNLALACQRSGAVLVYFSTDYVFDGKKNAAYEETDLPAPLNVYGASKVLGEHLIACNTDRYFVIRTCGLYGTAGSSGKGGNFVENMLKKATAGDASRVVADQVLTPTYTMDLAGVSLSAQGLPHNRMLTAAPNLPEVGWFSRTGPDLLTR